MFESCMESGVVVCSSQSPDKPLAQCVVIVRAGAQFQAHVLGEHTFFRCVHAACCFDGVCALAMLLLARSTCLTRACCLTR